ncbi:MAG: deoxyribonuclease IV [Streptosporangiaceae bacterium]
MPAAAARPVGAHVHATGGLATGGLRYAAAVRAEAIQVFAANPRSWAQAAGDPGQDRALHEHADRTGLVVFVHAPYLINPASPDPLIRDRSAAAIRHSLARAAAIGARGVVVHTGSATDGDRDAGLWRAGACLMPILEQIGGGPDLLLEPMAGQGQVLCAAVADLGPYLEAVHGHPRAGVCLDTCHLFAAGHDLAAPRGVDDMLGQVALAARGRLRLIHANDSRDGCGSRRDRHENIGAGQIGAQAFGRLLAHPATAGVPFIVETPGGEKGHAGDVAALRALRAAALRPAPAGQSGGPSPGAS